MSCGSFVGLANDATRTMKEAVDCGTGQDPQGAERHCERKKSTGVFEDCTKGIGIGVHVASLGWNDMLAERRRDDVCRCAQAAIAILKKLLKLVAVALPPGTWIESREQVSEAGIHKASSLFNPALVNCCRVVSLARRMRRPSPVMR